MFLILDVYSKQNHRLIKDTAGGYGTANNFGSNLFSKFLNIFVDSMMGMPPMNIMYVQKILGVDNAFYTRSLEEALVRDYEYAIISSSIICHETEIDAIKKLSKINKKIFIVGIFANVMKEKYSIDNAVVIPGEAESFFLNLKKENKLTKVFLDKFYYDKNRKFTHGLVENLDELDFPDWHQYQKKYPLRNNFLSFNSDVAIPILASRGCPYSCFQYCTYPLQQGRKVRSRSPDNIVKEILYWNKNYGYKKFVFRDPVFSINRKHTIELCNLIIQKKLKIKFLIETHLNNLDEEMLPLLKRAGLELVYVGIESSNNDILSNINRFTVKKDKQYQIIYKLKKENIVVKSMYMLGNPEDTKETIKKTVTYSKFLPNQLVQFSIFTPYPGTPIYSMYQKKISEKKFEKFNQYNLVFEHKNLSKDELIQLKNFSYLSFYLDIKKILMILKTIIISRFKYAIIRLG